MTEQEFQRQGRDLLAAECRRTEVLIGKLLGPAPQPGKDVGRGRELASPTGEAIPNVPREDRHKFRLLAAHEGPDMTERAFQRQVIDLARLLGWRVAHFRPARTTHGWRTAVEGDGAGFPDLVLLRGEELLVAELKREGGQTTAAQAAWLDAFRAAGVPAFCWRPRDWPAIETALGLVRA